MAKKSKEQKFYCQRCGCELNEQNCRPNPENLSGLSCYCVECEQAIYNNFAKTQGKYHALLFACACFNTPCKPLLLDGVNLDEEQDGWITYINLLSESGLDTKNGKVLGFADGATTLWGLFGTTLSAKDFSGRIEAEKKKIKAQVGTEEQRERWGTEPLYIPQNKTMPKLVMTAEVYNELDRLYENRAEGLKGTTITPQIEYTLVTVAKNMAIYNHLLRNGLIKPAQDMWKTIDGMLASENLRKKDEKPVEALRIDALVLALEEAGLMENGDLLTYDELIEVMRDKFVKSKKYNQSLDVADQVILDVINSMRKNADLPTIQDLPEEFAAVDEYGEFEPEETEREKENKKYLGITKVNVVKSDKGDK